ncbi:hypothetical protein KDA06_03510 [Candidatus Saccharibacteria bacterium]|nr:hypothetical protein [Candidatus Saccharibacteria bacterium]
MTKCAYSEPQEFYPFKIAKSGVQVLDVPTEHYSSDYVAQLHQAALAHPEQQQIAFTPGQADCNEGNSSLYSAGTLRAGHKRALQLAKLVGTARGTAAEELAVQQAGRYKEVAGFVNGLEHIFSAPIEATPLQNPQKSQRKVDFSHA